MLGFSSAVAQISDGWLCGANFLSFASYNQLNYRGILMRAGHKLLPSSEPHVRTSYFTWSSARPKQFSGFRSGHTYEYVLKNKKFKPSASCFAISSRLASHTTARKKWRESSRELPSPFYLACEWKRSPPTLEESSKVLEIFARRTFASRRLLSFASQPQRLYGCRGEPLFWSEMPMTLVCIFLSTWAFCSVIMTLLSVHCSEKEIFVFVM